jgi:hypothetical protein
MASANGERHWFALHTSSTEGMINQTPAARREGSSDGW